MSKEKKYMNFNEMLECLEKGEKVRLSTWQENNYIGIRSNMSLVIVIYTQPIGKYINQVKA